MSKQRAQHISEVTNIGALFFVVEKGNLGI